MAKHRKRKRDPRNSSRGPSAGSNAGRGFRYQDRYGALLAVQGYVGLCDVEELIPEGSDDFELHSTNALILIDTKATRETARARTPAEDAEALRSIWERSIAKAPSHTEYWLVLQRTENSYVSNAPRKPAMETRLEPLLRGNEKARTSFVSIEPSPHTEACRLLVDHSGLAPLVAHLVCLALARRIGELADANGPLPLPDRKGLAKSDVRAAIDRVLLVFQSERVEAVILAGNIQAIDFSTPFHDEGFYLGVDVQPGHFASGQAVHRPKSVGEAVQTLKRKRICVVKGPSGSGKSALMWDIARSTRRQRSWFNVRAASGFESEALTAFLAAYTDLGPIGFIVDDIGRGQVQAFDQLIAAVSGSDDVWVLGSIRSEDMILIPHGKLVAILENKPDERVAEKIWQNLKNDAQTEWAGWKEPWKRSDGLLLEYGHVLTLGERLEEVIGEQVKARLTDKARDNELAILSRTAPVAALGGTVKIDDLKASIGLSDSDAARALTRLIEEHLIRVNTKQDEISGLHALRAEAICDALDGLSYATRTRQAEFAVMTASEQSLETVVSGVAYYGHLEIDAIAFSTRARQTGEEGKLHTWAKVCQGLKQGGLRKIAEDWLEHASANGLSPKLATSAALFGAVEGDGFSAFPAAVQIQELGADLHERAQQTRLPLIAIEEIISGIEHLVSMHDGEHLSKTLSALIGSELTEDQVTRLSDVTLDFDALPINQVVDILDAASSVSADIVLSWLGSGPANNLSLSLLSRLQAETPFALPIVMEVEDDGLIVEGNINQAALAAEESDANATMVAHCHAMLMLAPSADKAHCRIVDTNGNTALSIDGEKRIPRTNSPPYSSIARNREIVDAVANAVGANSWSSYLANGEELLIRAVRAFAQLLDCVCVHKAPQALVDDLNAVNSDTDILIAPSEPHIDGGVSGRHLTPLQNLVFELNGKLVLRIAKLPEGAAALAAHVGDLRQRVDEARKEPWDLIADQPPKKLDVAEQLLADLEITALEAAASGQDPRQRWLKSGGKPRHAFRLVANGSRKAFSARMKSRYRDIKKGLATNTLRCDIIGPTLADGILWQQRYIVLVHIQSLDEWKAWMRCPSKIASRIAASFATSEDAALIPVVNAKAAMDHSWLISRRRFLDSLDERSISEHPFLGPPHEDIASRVTVPRLAPITAIQMTVSAIQTILAMSATDSQMDQRPAEEVRLFENALDTLEDNQAGFSKWAQRTDNSALLAVEGAIKMILSDEEEAPASEIQMEPADLIEGIAEAHWYAAHDAN
jgi:hypothetical protein|tara:strand:+ start:4333 stop:8157 length:3825 start_codon:yes stop_codon:yes gene_type:complete